MDETVAQLVIAGMGVAGTLAAALLTQHLARRAERERREEEDKSRWLTERLAVSKRIITGALSLERDLWSACSMLEPDTRQERMPGYTTILLTPEQGLPGIFDEVTRSILVEAIEDGFARLEELEEHVAEMALIGSPEEGGSARRLQERLWDVVGLMETYAPFNEAADAVERARGARDAFTEAVRARLRVEGEAIAPDGRPRQEQDQGPRGASSTLD